MEILEDDGPEVTGDPSQDLNSGYVGRKPAEETKDEEDREQ